MTELWLDSISVSEYRVSSLGRIMRIPHKKPMPNGGYRTYGGQPYKGVWEPKQQRYIMVVNKKKTYRVARIICEAFHGPKPFPDAVCMHLDEDPRNNKPENLAWGTQKHNLNAPKFLEYTSSVCTKKMAGMTVKNTRVVEP